MKATKTEAQRLALLAQTARLERLELQTELLQIKSSSQGIRGFARGLFGGFSALGSNSAHIAGLAAKTVAIPLLLGLSKKTLRSSKGRKVVGLGVLVASAVGLLRLINDSHTPSTAQETEETLADPQDHE